MDDTSNGKPSSRLEDSERAWNAPDEFYIEESILASSVSTTTAADERGEDHLAAMPMEGAQTRARSLTQEERNHQMNEDPSFMVERPRKKAKHKEGDQDDMSNDYDLRQHDKHNQQTRSQLNVYKTEASKQQDATEQTVTVSESAVKTEPVTSILTEDHEPSDYHQQEQQQQQQQQQQQRHRHAAAQQHQNTQKQEQRQPRLEAQTTTEVVRDDGKLPSAVARNLLDTSGKSDSDKRLPVGAVIRFRVNKNDDWRTGTIIRAIEQGTGAGHAYNDIHNEKSSFCYRVEPIWSHDEVETANSVKHSDSFFQRLSKNDLEELEERICSEFDQLFVTHGHDLKVTFDRFKITTKTSEGLLRECNYRLTDAMLIRVGASFRQHCRVLKHFTINGTFCNCFSRDASTVFVRDIASACSPTVTTLCLNYMDGYVDHVLETLVSEKTHILRELQLGRCTYSSLAFLQRLSRSFSILDLRCIIQGRCWNDLDEFFKTQTRMKDPVLQCLRFGGDGPPLHKILGCLRRHDFLKVLHLRKSYLRPPEFYQPAHYFSNPVDALQLRQFLQASKVLRALHLDFYIDERQCSTIAEGLARCSSLQELTIHASTNNRFPVKTIVSALVQQFKGNPQQGLRVLRLRPWCRPFFINAPDDVRYLVRQLERLPAVRHVQLANNTDFARVWLAKSVCNSIVVDALEQSLTLEKLEYGDFGSRLKASVNSLCRVNRILNRHIPTILDDPKKVPLYLWSMILASISPKAIGLFNMLHAFPKLVDPQYRRTVVKKN